MRTAAGAWTPALRSRTTVASSRGVRSRGATGVLGGRVSSITPTPLQASVLGSASVSSFAVSGRTPGRPAGRSPRRCCRRRTSTRARGERRRLLLGQERARRTRQQICPTRVLSLPTFARLGTRAYAQQIAAGRRRRASASPTAPSGAPVRTSAASSGPAPRAVLERIRRRALCSMLKRLSQVAVAKETDLARLLRAVSPACLGGKRIWRAWSRHAATTTPTLGT